MACLFPRATKTALSKEGVLTTSYWETWGGQDAGLQWCFCLVFYFFKARTPRWPRDGEEEHASPAHGHDYLCRWDAGDACTAFAVYGDAALALCSVAKLTDQHITLRFGFVFIQVAKMLKMPKPQSNPFINVISLSIYNNIIILCLAQWENRFDFETEIHLHNPMG